MIQFTFRRCHSYLFALLTTLLLMSGCGNGEKDASDADLSVQVKAGRFEQDLFSDPSGDSSLAELLQQRYGTFFDIFVWQLTRLGSRSLPEMESNLRAFANDTSFLAVNAAIQRRFGDFSSYDSLLSIAFSKYHQLLPQNVVPQVLTTLSVFSYPVICDSTHLAISLDMYLDPGCEFYNTLQPPLPNYLRRKMRPEYVVSDAVKGWLQSDYQVDEAGADLLQSMVSAGRIWYVTKEILPDTPDSLICGYTRAQLDWCDANESKVWAFLINNKLLYAKDPNVLMKYVGEGPTTNGFPVESPGNIGQYVGYRIVSAYMKGHSDVTPARLLAEKDLGKIFRESKYKPKR